MKSTKLTEDYLKRSAARLEAINVLLEKESFADVVRESQEVVELTLKALLRSCNIEVPRIHDVSAVIEDNKERIPNKLKSSIPKITEISKQLRRDRELAFYGSEDLTPTDFYKLKDAKLAFESASWVHKVVSEVVPTKEYS